MTLWRPLMKRIKSPKSFRRTLKKLFAKNRELKNTFREVFDKLAEDPFTPSLKTHKLKGRLKEFRACAVTSDIRLIFQLETDDESNLNLTVWYISYQRENQAVIPPNHIDHSRLIPLLPANPAILVSRNPASFHPAFPTNNPVYHQESSDNTVHEAWCL